MTKSYSIPLENQNHKFIDNFSLIYPTHYSKVSFDNEQFVSSSAQYPHNYFTLTSLFTPFFLIITVIKKIKKIMIKKCQKKLKLLPDSKSIKAIIWIILLSLSTVISAAYTGLEKKTCNPMLGFSSNNLLVDPNSVLPPYTGYRVQRLYGYTAFPGYFKTRHIVTISHCKNGAVDYGPAVVPISKHDDMAWGVNICGGSINPVEHTAWTFSEGITKSKVMIKNKIKSLRVSNNPYHRSQQQTAIWIKWLTSAQRKRVFDTVRNITVHFENEYEALIESRREMLRKSDKEVSYDYDYDYDSYEDWDNQNYYEAYDQAYDEDDDNIIDESETPSLGFRSFLREKLKRPVSKIVSWKRRTMLATAIKFEQMLNGTLPLPPIEPSDPVINRSNKSKNWRVFGLMQNSIAKYFAKSEYDPNKNYSGTSNSKPELSKLSSSPLHPFGEPSPYCFRLVRKKKYALRDISVYMPSTTVGGLFLCPRYGHCTNDNAVPLMPIKPDYYQGQWIQKGPKSWFQTAIDNAKRTEFINAKRKGKGTIKMYRDEFELKQKYRSNKKNNAQDSFLRDNPDDHWLTGKIKSLFYKGYSLADISIGLLGNKLPVSVSLRRSIIQRVPFFYTLPFDERRRGHEFESMSGNWPLWARGMDVNEEYNYNPTEISLSEAAIRNTVNIMSNAINAMNVTFDTIHVHKSKLKPRLKGKSAKAQKNKHDGYRNQIEIPLKQHSGIWALRNWPFTSVFSNNMLYRLRLEGFTQSKFWKLISSLQKPFDDIINDELD